MVVERLSAPTLLFHDAGTSSGIGVSPIQHPLFEEVVQEEEKVFVVQTRAFGRSKRVTLGAHGDITTEIARRDANEVIA